MPNFIQQSQKSFKVTNVYLLKKNLAKKRDVVLVKGHLTKEILFCSRDRTFYVAFSVNDGEIGIGEASLSIIIYFFCVKKAFIAEH